MSEQPSGASGTTVTINGEEEQIGRFVWVERLRKNNPQDLSTLVHELFHLVIRIMSDRDVPVRSHIYDTDKNSYYGDEPAAYLIDSFFLQVLEHLRSK